MLLRRLKNGSLRRRRAGESGRRCHRGLWLLELLARLRHRERQVATLLIDVEVLGEESGNLPIVKHRNAWQAGEGIEELLGRLIAVFWTKRDSAKTDGVESVAHRGARARWRGSDTVLEEIGERARGEELPKHDAE